jgi:molybdenum cofactor cytidylyltransferase
VKFGPVPLADAEGAILAHSLVLKDGPLKKGTRLDAGDISRAAASGLTEVIAARFEPGDVSEDEAARSVGELLSAEGLRLGPVFTGRINLIAGKAGIVRVDTAAIDAMNAIDEGLTIATLPDLMRVEADQLVATVKVIPYGLPEAPVRAGIAALGGAPIRLAPFRGGTSRLILTKTPGFKDSLLSKGEEIVRTRVEALGYALNDVRTVAHAEADIAAALTDDADLTLILGASATSDRHDVAPAAVVDAGGRIERFGMPVDPGNLLFLGELRGKPVVGLPGCARSPALNGVDWVLERLSAGIPVRGADIAAMGVGGLLKEMQGRPQPRRPRS